MAGKSPEQAAAPSHGAGGGSSARDASSVGASASHAGGELAIRLQHLAIEAALNGILITDPTVEDNPIVYANPGFLTLTGYGLAEVIGRNCRFLQGPQTDPESVAVVRNAVQKGQACQVTLLNYKQDGTPFWNDLQLTPVHGDDGRLLNFVGIQHDITARVEAEAKIRRYAERMQGILDTTAEGIYGIDRNGLCTFCNRSALRLLGYDSEEQVLGRNMHELIHHTRPDGSGYPEPECRIFAASRDNVAVHAEDELFWKPDGSSFPAEYWSRPLLRDGKVLGAVVTFQDISDRQQTLQKLRESEQALRVSEHAAQQASLAKSAFLANMSHELRTPMTAVLGFADMLKSESSDPVYREKVETIQRNGTYLLSLLDDILDLSKIEAGKMSVDRDTLELQAVIEDVRSLMGVRAVQEGIPLRFIWSSEVPRTITADPKRIRQILVNLIGNALKFTDEGEVQVVVEVARGTQQPALQIAVVDTGIGMTLEQQETLFEPFTQAHAAARRFGGTGLGLSISKRLAEAMGGTISVESQLGVGSRFTLSLPLSPGQLESLVAIDDSEPVPDRPSSVEEPFPSFEARILLADDRRDVWRVARYFLEKCGARVTVAEDGQQAVEATERASHEGAPFDLILMDMQMPIMTGAEAIAAIRERGYQTPIVALTADAMDGNRETCLGLGCNEFLPKPIDGRQLVQLVASLV